MPIYAFEGRRPKIAESAYVAPSAVIIGQVTVSERCYIGPGAILRGDYGTIEIGDESSVEEGVIVHARPGDLTHIGRRVTLGHGALVHNATIHDGAFVGMRAVVSDFAEVGQGAIVGEMGLVKSRQNVPPGKVAVGLPVQVVGDVGHRHRIMTHTAKDLYVKLAARYRSGGLVKLESTTEPAKSLGQMVPIGTIHTPFETRGEGPIQGAMAKQAKGEVRLFEGYREGLTDLDGFSHIILIYAFHEIEGPELTVTPYLEDKPKGVFATRHPARPNPIGLTVVTLLEVSGSQLSVEGVDMIDGTPLLDIKPYVPAFDIREGARCGWLEPHLESI